MLNIERILVTAQNGTTEFEYKVRFSNTHCFNQDEENVIKLLEKLSYENMIDCESD